MDIHVVILLGIHIGFRPRNQNECYGVTFVLSL